jgi:hypothetical protein
MKLGVYQTMLVKNKVALGGISATFDQCILNSSNSVEGRKTIPVVFAHIFVTRRLRGESILRRSYSIQLHLFLDPVNFL